MSISGCRMLAATDHECASPWWTAGSIGPTLSVKRSGTGSKPPWLKGLQRSRRQLASSRPRAAPKRLHRLGGVGGAGRLVAAAARQRRRDPALVGADQGQEDPFHVERSPGRRRPAPPRCWPARPLLPSRSIRSPISGRATRTKSWPAGSWSERPQKASRRTRLTRLRSTAPPTLRLDRDTEPHLVVLLVALRGKL